MNKGKYGQNKGKYFSAVSRKIDQELKMITDLTGGQIPYGTLTKIAKINNVSREYVRQKANRLDLIPFYVISVKVKYCINCKKEFNSTRGGKKHCSPKCYKEYAYKKYWTSKKCKICGKDIVFLKSINRIPIYCSKTCMGKYMGKKYGRDGLKKFWEMRERYSPYPKTKKELIKNLGEEFTSSDFARKYNIVYSTTNKKLFDYQIKGFIKIDRKVGRENIYKVRS